MNSEELRRVYVQQAARAYRKSDKERWKSALWCSRVVGKYDRGATKGLAEDMGLSVDTVEDLAHAYMLFEDLCKLPDARLFVIFFSSSIGFLTMRLMRRGKSGRSISFCISRSTLRA